MARNYTIAAVLQLIAASVYLPLGVISSQNLHVVEILLFVSMAYHGGLYGFPNSNFVAFFSATIMPLVVGAIGLILVYGLWKEIKHTWQVSVYLNFLGLFVIVVIFVPLLWAFQWGYLAPSRPESWVPYISILFPLVPVVVILSMAATIYALAVGLGGASLPETD